MARTYRKLRQNLSAAFRHALWEQGLLKADQTRDGVPQYAAPSCTHHGGCPVCEGNRIFAEKRQAPIEELP